MECDFFSGEDERDRDGEEGERVGDFDSASAVFFLKSFGSTMRCEKREIEEAW